MSWTERESVEGYEQALWKMIAVVGRYGSFPPTSALSWDLWYLERYAAALGELIREENKPRDH